MGDLGGFVESEDNMSFADAGNNGNFDHDDLGLSNRMNELFGRSEEQSMDIKKINMNKRK